ncbi:probable disease resistance protein At1g61300 [Typha angustifolia]|uniref:probable disease resistance protein At1g61300 n=1 Tax=Typha angustifolia TaxID=59011 RepID=UPI003C2BA991
MEILSKVADLALAPSFNFVMRQLTYPFKADDNVRALQSASGHLLTRKDDVVEMIEIAERNGQKPTHQLQEWLDEVKATKAQVDEIVEKYKQRWLCFKCFSPNCCSNYSLSKTAAELLLDVQRLLNDERTKELAITLAPPPVQEVPVPTTSTSSPNANQNLEEALRYIKDDQVGMIGIWGMGGVGKTTLLQRINNSFIGDSSFDVVIVVTASQSCTTEKIQNEIAENLKLQRDGDVSRKAKIIFNFLSKRSFLLLLDDLWGRLDLQDVGIPFPLGMVGEHKRKVVLTTRSIAVCGQMEVRKRIKVECLNENDAWSLFLEKVGEETINSHPRVPSLAKDVIKELEGLPLALITIGRAMYEKKDPKQWEYSINLLRNSRLHEVEQTGMEEETTFYRLKFSYDSLKSDTLRECFLSCSMWPEDCSISKSRLIKCWMGLGLIKEFASMSEAYNAGHTLIGDLIGACLLEQNQQYDFFLRMHDVLRDMALWIARDNGKNKNKWIVPGDDRPLDKEIWQEAERISRVFDDLKVLGNIRAFVALTYLDLSYCVLFCFPIEICGLVQLQYLNLEENCIQSLPEELGSLVNLKFLILRHNAVQTIPQGVITKLKSLQVLDLYEPDGIIERNLTYLPSLVFKELECLNNLRGLGICVEGISQLNKIIELPSLSVRSLAVSRLESTSFSFPSSFLSNEKIQSNLAELCLKKSNVTQVVMESSHLHHTWHLRSLEKLKILNLRCLEEIIWKGVVPRELFQALSILSIKGCNMLKNISWVLHLPCLNNLRVIKCSTMRQLIADGTENHGENIADIAEKEEKGIMLTSTFPCLKEIFLDDLPEIVSICHSMFAFPALDNITVYECPKLKKLPFRPGNIPSKIRRIKGTKKWWEGLEWEDSGVRTFLQPFYEEDSDSDDSVSADSG